MILIREDFDILMNIMNQFNIKYFYRHPIMVIAFMVDMQNYIIKKQ